VESAGCLVRDISRNLPFAPPCTKHRGSRTPPKVFRGAFMSDFERARRHMVDGQVRTAGVTDPAVIEAMLAVPREEFVGAANRAIAYLDLQLEVAPRRRLVTPMIVGRLLQAAGIAVGRSVLIVGCATGYTAAVA